VADGERDGPVLVVGVTLPEGETVGDTDAAASNREDTPPVDAPTKGTDVAARVADSRSASTDAPTIKASVAPQNAAPKKPRRAAEKREFEKPSKKKAKRKAKTPSE
jgi:hypothetical protein